MGKYNLKFIKEISSDSDSEIHEFLLIFCRDVYEAIHKIKDGFDQNNLDQMRFYSHKIKPSLKFLGLQAELEIASEIEKLNENSKIDELKLMVDFVYSSLLEVIKDIKINELKMEIVQV
jgi:HPt (histidine-containing phosphotransfer) domain-containing protein